MIYNDIIYSFFVFVILTLLSRRCCMNFCPVLQNIVIDYLLLNV